MISNKKIKFIIKLTFSALFLWWVIFKVDWTEVLNNILQIKPYYLFLYVALYFLGMIFSSLKWQFLAKVKKIHYPLSKFFKLYFSATFINNFMPSFIGGDAFKSYEIGNARKKYKEAISSVVVDRITGLWGAMILALFFSILNYSTTLQNKILLFINLAIIGGLLLSYLLLKLPKFFSILPEKGKNFFQKGIREVWSYHEKSNTILKAIGLSFIFNFVGLAGANYVLFWALGIEVGLLNYLSMIFLISIVSSVPLTINNIGIKEWAYITFFGFLGISSSAVVAVVLISRLLQMLLSFLAWPIYLKGNQLRRKK